MRPPPEASINMAWMHKVQPPPLKKVLAAPELPGRFLLRRLNCIPTVV